MPYPREGWGQEEDKKETELGHPPPPKITQTNTQVCQKEKEANMVGKKSCCFGLGAKGENHSIAL